MAWSQCPSNRDAAAPPGNTVIRKNRVVRASGQRESERVQQARGTVMATNALATIYRPRNRSRSALQRADRAGDRLRRRALSGTAIARADGRGRPPVSFPLPARVQALGGREPEALPAVCHPGARQAPPGRRRQRARCRARGGPLGAEPSARPVHHLRGDDARGVQGARLAPGDPLGTARRPAWARAARSDRARHLLAQLRHRRRCRGDRRIPARVARRDAGA